MNAEKILLANGMEALVDDEDFGSLSEYRWFAKKDRNTFYASRTKNSPMVNWQRTVRTIRMHHEIMGKPQKGFVVDHINGNGLDNRRSNLRIVSYRVNGANRGEHRLKQTASGFPGVTRAGKKWVARTKINGKNVAIGRFDSPREAHEAYISVCRSFDAAFNMATGKE